MINPKIRFKKNNGEEFPAWSSAKIGEILEIKHGKDYKGLLPGDIPVLGTGGVISHVSSSLCNWPCVLIGRKGTINKPQFMDKPFWSVDTLFYSKPKENNSPKFQFFLFQTINWLKYSEATGVPSLSASTIENIIKLVPCLEEQQKIAFFFSTLDQKIELNERKLEALEKLKKGLMQKIFSREIRFKQEDGSDFPKWNNKRLGEVACLNNGRAYKQEELLNEGKYVVLRVGNFFTNEKYYYSNMELESCKYAHKGDLLYCWSASFGPKIWDGEKVIYHYHIWKIDPINIDRNYLYYYLQRDVVNLEQEMNGGTMMHLTKANMELRSVEIPVIEEQTKIASLFIHFDKKIELVLAKINSLKKLKQGFMQQMFV